MLGFKELVSELARQEVTLSAQEVAELLGRFGGRVRQMGHLQADGSMTVPVECIVEAARSLGNERLVEAGESLRYSGEGMMPLFESAGALIDSIGEARARRLRGMVGRFQDEADEKAAEAHWKEIEREVFGVEYPD